ncbi:MAG: ribonuclease P protein component [Candidatus Brennerbacteria bacterium]
MVIPPPLLRVRSASSDSRGARRVPRGKKGRIVIITVSRKAAPLAVTRNRIRRRIRAGLAKAGITPKNAIMIVGTAQVAEAPFPRLVEEIKNVLHPYE